MPRITQEFHCTKSGGGCGGFFLATLNMALNMRAEIVCPKCQHKHIRYIVDGEIRENGRFDSSHGQVKEEICPTMGSWSEKPRTIHMTKYAGKDHVKERDGAVIKKKKDVVPEERSELAASLIRESWIERFADRL